MGVQKTQGGPSENAAGTTQAAQPPPAFLAVVRPLEPIGRVFQNAGNALRDATFTFAETLDTRMPQTAEQFANKSRMVEWRAGRVESDDPRIREAARITAGLAKFATNEMRTAEADLRNAQEARARGDEAGARGFETSAREHAETARTHMNEAMGKAQGLRQFGFYQSDNPAEINRAWSATIDDWGLPSQGRAELILQDTKFIHDYRGQLESGAPGMHEAYSRVVAHAGAVADTARRGEAFTPEMAQRFSQEFAQISQPVLLLVGSLKQAEFALAGILQLQRDAQYKAIVGGVLDELKKLFERMDKGEEVKEEEKARAHETASYVQEADSEIEGMPADARAGAEKMVARGIVALRAGKRAEAAIQRGLARALAKTKDPEQKEMLERASAWLSEGKLEAKDVGNMLERDGALRKLDSMVLGGRRLYGAEVAEIRALDRQAAGLMKKADELREKARLEKSPAKRKELEMQAGELEGKAKQLLRMADAKTKGLLGIAKLEKELRENRVPEPVIKAVRASYRFFGTISQWRADVVFKAAGFVSDNRDILKSPMAKPVMDAFVKFLGVLTGPKKDAEIGGQKKAEDYLARELEPKALEAGLAQAGGKAAAELMKGVKAAAGFLGTREQWRGQLILKAARFFLDNREKLTGKSGVKALAGLLGFIARLSDPEEKLDEREMERDFEGILKEAAGIPKEPAKAEERKAPEKKAETPAAGTPVRARAMGEVLHPEQRAGYARELEKRKSELADILPYLPPELRKQAEAEMKKADELIARLKNPQEPVGVEEAVSRSADMKLFSWRVLESALKKAGAPDIMIKAVRLGARFAGSKRGAQILDMAALFLGGRRLFKAQENKDALEEMGKMMEGVATMDDAGYAEAKEKVDAFIGTAGQDVAREKKRQQEEAGQKAELAGQAAAGLDRMIEGGATGGGSEAWQDSLAKLSAKLKDIASRLGYAHPENPVTDEEYGGAVEGYDYAKRAGEALGGIADSHVREDAGTIFARGLEALGSGNAEDAKLQEVLANEYVKADADYRKRIMQWSVALEKGEMKPEEAMQRIADDKRARELEASMASGMDALAAGISSFRASADFRKYAGDAEPYVRKAEEWHAKASGYMHEAEGLEGEARLGKVRLAEEALKRSEELLGHAGKLVELREADAPEAVVSAYKLAADSYVAVFEPPRPGLATEEQVFPQDVLAYASVVFSAADSYIYFRKHGREDAEKRAERLITGTTFASGIAGAGAELQGLEGERDYAEKIDSEVAARRKAVFDAATELRGNTKRVPKPAEGTAEWYGQMALEALERGDLDVAHLAVYRGLFEKAAPGGGKGYIPGEADRDINAVLKSVKVPDQGELDGYLGLIDAASLVAQADMLEKDNPASGGAEERARKERVHKLAGEVKRRAGARDFDGANRLLGMAMAYAGLANDKKWRAFAGSDRLEAALDAELAGGDQSKQFEDAVVYHNTCEETSRFRASLSDWGPGLDEGRKLVERGLLRVEQLAGEGKGQEAAALFGQLMLYAGAVRTFGAPKKGDRIPGFDPAYDSTKLDGMGLALDATIRGETQVGGKKAEEVFSQSYSATQKEYVNKRADSYLKLSEKMPAGRETVGQGLAEARRRAENGDFEGALRLLEMAGNYYGEATPGRQAGWRYREAAASGSGYDMGRQDMLGAISMEVAAKRPEDHEEALKAFNSGAERISSTKALQARYELISRHTYNAKPGERLGIENWDTPPGMLALRGEPTADSADGPLIGYVKMEDIRRYEGEHPEDAALAGEPTLEQLVKKMERAASAGDEKAYRRYQEAFLQRVYKVAGRIYQIGEFDGRRKSFGSYVEVVGGFDSALIVNQVVPMGWLEGDDKRQKRIESLEKQYKNNEISKTQFELWFGEILSERLQMVEQGRFAESVPQKTRDEVRSFFSRIKPLAERVRQFNAKLQGADFRKEKFPAEEYDKLTAEVDALIGFSQTYRKIAIGYAEADRQMGLNKGYREAVAGEGEAGNDAAGKLDTSTKFLNDAKQFLLAGDLESARKSYEGAMNARKQALYVYSGEVWAVNLPSISQVAGAQRARVGLMGPDPRFYSVMNRGGTLVGQLPQRAGDIDKFYGKYVDLAMEGWDAMLAGNGGRAESRGKRTMAVEASVFYVATRSGSTLDKINTLVTYGGWQEEIRKEAYEGDADYAMYLMEKLLKAHTYSKVAEAVGMFALTIATMGMGSVGFVIGGGNMVWDAIEAIEKDKAKYGHVTAMSWVNLGLTVVGLGASVATGRLVRGAETAIKAAKAADAVEFTSQVARAGRFATAARIVAYTDITVNVVGMVPQFYTGIELMAEGRYVEGTQQLAFGVFSGIMAYHGGISQLRMMRGMRTEIAKMDALKQAHAEAPKVFAELGTPEGMFAFLKKVRENDPVSLVIYDNLPKPQRIMFDGMLSDRNVVTALKKNDIGLATTEFGRGVDNFKLLSDLGATRALTDAAHLGTQSGLEPFIKDLLIPEDATGPQRTRRDAAYARLREMKKRPETAEAAATIETLLKDKDVQKWNENGVQKIGQASEDIRFQQMDTINKYTDMIVGGEAAGLGLYSSEGTAARANAKRIGDAYLDYTRAKMEGRAIDWEGYAKKMGMGAEDAKKLFAALDASADVRTAAGIISSVGVRQAVRNRVALDGQAVLDGTPLTELAGEGVLFSRWDRLTPEDLAGMAANRRERAAEELEGAGREKDEKLASARRERAGILSREADALEAEAQRRHAAPVGGFTAQGLRARSKAKFEEAQRLRGQGREDEAFALETECRRNNALAADLDGFAKFGIVRVTEDGLFVHRDFPDRRYTRAELEDAKTVVNAIKKRGIPTSESALALYDGLPKEVKRDYKGGEDALMKSVLDTAYSMREKPPEAAGGAVTGEKVVQDYIGRESERITHLPEEERPAATARMQANAEFLSEKSLADPANAKAWSDFIFQNPEFGRYAALAREGRTASGQNVEFRPVDSPVGDKDVAGALTKSFDKKPDVAALAGNLPEGWLYAAGVEREAIVALAKADPAKAVETVNAILKWHNLVLVQNNGFFLAEVTHVIAPRGSENAAGFVIGNVYGKGDMFAGRDAMYNIPGTTVFLKGDKSYAESGIPTADLLMLRERYGHETQHLLDHAAGMMAAYSRESAGKGMAGMPEFKAGLETTAVAREVGEMLTTMDGAQVGKDLDEKIASKRQPPEYKAAYERSLKALSTDENGVPDPDWRTRSPEVLKARLDRFIDAEYKRMVGLGYSRLYGGGVDAVPKAKTRRADIAREAIPQDKVSRDAYREAILKKAGSGANLPEWIVGGERVREGGVEAFDTGRVLNMVEDIVVNNAAGGRESDVIVISADKRRLNQINDIFGLGNGDVALDAYREILKRATGMSAGGGFSIMMRPSPRGDEVIAVIVVKKGRGGEVRAAIEANVARATDEVFAERSEPGHPKYIGDLGKALRNPRDVVAASVLVSAVVEVRVADGAVTATYHDDGDAYIVRNDGSTEFLAPTATKVDDPYFAAGLRKTLGVEEQHDIAKGLEPAEQQRLRGLWERRKGPLTPEDAAIALRMKEVYDKRLEAGTSQDIAAQDAVTAVAAERANVAPDEVLAQGGVAFEIRLVLPGPVRKQMLGLLPEVGKGLAEVVNNNFGIRGLNTYLGHYGANRVVSVVDGAVAEFAEAHGVRIRRLGSMKYVIEGGTLDLSAQLYNHVETVLKKAGIGMTVSDKPEVAVIEPGTDGKTALAHVSNGHLVVDRRIDVSGTTDWDGQIELYQNANALIGLMALGSDETLVSIISRGNRTTLEPIIKLVREHPEIRNFEDLVFALRDPQYGGENGTALEGLFRKFIVDTAPTFRTGLAERFPDSAAAEESVPQPAPRAEAAPEPPAEAGARLIEEKTGFYDKYRNDPAMRKIRGERGSVSADARPGMTDEFIKQARAKKAAGKPLTEADEAALDIAAREEALRSGAPATSAAPRLDEPAELAAFARKIVLGERTALEQYESLAPEIKEKVALLTQDETFRGAARSDFMFKSYVEDPHGLGKRLVDETAGAIHGISHPQVESAAPGAAADVIKGVPSGARELTGKDRSPKALLGDGVTPGDVKVVAGGNEYRFNGGVETDGETYVRFTTGRQKNETHILIKRAPEGMEPKARAEYYRNRLESAIAEPAVLESSGAPAAEPVPQPAEKAPVAVDREAARKSLTDGRIAELETQEKLLAGSAYARVVRGESAEGEGATPGMKLGPSEEAWAALAQTPVEERGILLTLDVLVQEAELFESSNGTQGRSLESIRSEYPEYYDAVAAAKTKPKSARTEALAAGAHAISESRGGAMGYYARRRVDWLVGTGMERGMAASEMEPALKLVEEQGGGPLLGGLVDEDMAMPTQRPREQVTMDLARAMALHAEEFMLKCRVGGKWQRPADPLEAFAFDATIARANEFDREPTVVDFAFGVLAAEALRTPIAKAPHLAKHILEGARLIISSVPVERVGEALSGYARTSGAIGGLFPDTSRTYPSDIAIGGETLRFAALLHMDGAKDPLSIFTNNSGTGLLDVFPPSDHGRIMQVGAAVEVFRDVYRMIPKERRGAMTEPLLRLALEDASRLSPESREEYLRMVGSGFKWSDELGTSAMEYDGRGRTPGGALEPTESGRIPDTRKRRLPMLGLLLAMDESAGNPLMTGGGTPRNAVRILDGKWMRNTLATDQVFRNFVGFMEMVTSAQTAVSALEGQWRVGIPEGAQRMEGPRGTAKSLLGADASEIYLQAGFRFEGGYSINGEVFVAFSRGEAGSEEIVLVKKQPPRGRGAEWSLPDTQQYYQTRLDAPAVKEWLEVSKAQMEYTEISEGERKGMGVSEKLSDARVSFQKDRVRNLTAIWDMYRMGKINSADLLGFGRNLGGKIETRDFMAGVAQNYRMLVPELNIPQKWAEENVDLFTDFILYRKTLEYLAGGGSFAFQDYLGTPESFAQAKALLDEAFMAQVEGRFSGFKFNRAFHEEFFSVASRAGIDAEAAFAKWSGESSFGIWDRFADGEATREIGYEVIETGGFERSFLYGIVKGQAACQHVRNMHPVVGGVAGSVVQPWVKQIAIIAPGEREATYRRTMTMVIGDDGRPVILLQPPFGMRDEPLVREHVDAAIVEHLRAEYEPLGIEVREIRGVDSEGHTFYGGVDELHEPAARVMVDGRVLPAGRPVNRGYRTFAFRAPFVYMDSNMIEMLMFNQRGQNGLQIAEPGVSVVYPVGSRPSIRR